MNEKITMDKPPIPIGSGKFGCPICKTPLVTGKSPYFIRDVRVTGEFESLRCNICNYSVLTEIGYEESGKKAQEMGLLESPEIIPEIGEATLETPQNVFTKNDFVWIPYYDGDELEPTEYPLIVMEFEKEQIPVLTSKRYSKF